MNKSFLSVLVLCFLMASRGSDGLESDYESYERNTDLAKDDPIVTEGHLLKRRSWRKYNETDIQGEVAYEYDDQDRLILVTSHYYYENTVPELNIVGGIVTYTYQDDHIIAKYSRHDTGLASTTHHIKESDNVVRTEVHYPDGTSHLSRITHFDPNGCGRSKYEWFNRDSERLGYDEYEYVDDNCNVIISVYLLDQNSKYTDYVTMDSKNAWNNSISWYRYFGNITHHNVLESRTEYTDENGINHIDSSYKCEYIYNSSDYPVSKIETSYDGKKMQYFYEYY